LNERDGWYVKVKSKRKSVFGTCWYLLHHCGVRTDKKRYHPVVWWGTCSYRALKVSEKMRAEYEKEHKKKCPICGMPLVKHEFLGRNKDVIALFHKTRGSRESVRGFYDRIEDWCEVAERGSGSYEQ